MQWVLALTVLLKFFLFPKFRKIFQKNFKIMSKKIPAKFQKISKTAFLQCVFHTPIHIVPPSHWSLKACAFEWSQSCSSWKLAVINWGRLHARLTQVLPPHIHRRILRTPCESPAPPPTHNTPQDTGWGIINPAGVFFGPQLHYVTSAPGTRLVPIVRRSRPPKGSARPPMESMRARSPSLARARPTRRVVWRLCSPGPWHSTGLPKPNQAIAPCKTPPGGEGGGPDTKRTKSANARAATRRADLWIPGVTGGN